MGEGKVQLRVALLTKLKLGPSLETRLKRGETEA